MTTDQGIKACPICGNDKFEWGIIRSTTYRSGLGVVGGGLKAVKAQRCISCHYVMLYTDDALTQRDQFFDLVGTVFRLAIPVLILFVIARPVWNFIQGLRYVMRQTLQVKAQIDTLSTQIDNVARIPLLLPNGRNGKDHAKNGRDTAPNKKDKHRRQD
jgi:predicted nucleic-acid-binding Zn-ribbon protein